MHKLFFGVCLLLSTSAFGQEYNHVMVFLNSKFDKEEIPVAEEEALQKAHRANIGQLVDEGKMIVAGPFEGGGGIFIMTTGNLSQAHGWLATDPAVKANRWDIELFPVRFTIGGGPCLAAEPIAMGSFSFVRVNYINDIANYKMNDMDGDIWSTILNKESILLAGNFPKRDGGIIVYRGEKNASWFGDNQSEQVSLTHKVLWVAKGSFCE
jgi:uncharacterized protein YciI